ncbi:CheC, inhibitor of MCP methylation [Candidatus Sulfopaludibacter sp. SbA6]|nr:CheC, inhibitor of MCP methylation [Candidatus Sulfopaludibacter sp. SbA6]
MTDTYLRLALAESVDEVLEKMFFVRTLGEPRDQAGEPAVTAHLTFDGDPPGWLTLRVTAAAARSVAADFLGEEESELSQRQIGEVVCELANMICGSVLSRVESNTTFRLATPQLIASGEEGEPAGRQPGIPPSATTLAAQIGSGAITVIFNTETTACSTAEKHEF